MSGGKDAAVPVFAVEDARSTAETYARSVIEVIGGPITSRGLRSRTSPCEGKNGELAKDGKYTLMHIYNVEVEPDRQIETLRRVLETWKAKGYEVKEHGLDRPGGRVGKINARTPADGFGLLVTSTSPPTEMTIWVTTPCLRPPPPGWTDAVTAGPSVSP